MCHLSQQCNVKISSRLSANPRVDFVQIASNLNRFANESLRSRTFRPLRVADDSRSSRSTAFRTFVVLFPTPPSRRRRQESEKGNSSRVPLGERPGRVESRIRLILSNIIKISVRVYFSFAKTFPFFLFFLRNATILRNIWLAPTPPGRVFSQKKAIRKAGNKRRTLTKKQGKPTPRLATVPFVGRRVSQRLRLEKKHFRGFP